MIVYGCVVGGGVLDAPCSRHYKFAPMLCEVVSLYRRGVREAAPYDTQLNYNLPPYAKGMCPPQL